MGEAADNEEVYHADFVEWAETVRDPAAKASEGKRILRAGKDAEASYQIAPLPDGRFAVKVCYTYHSGNCSTLSSPWCAFESRDACLGRFLDGARHHFNDIRHIASEAQMKAQKKMAALLDAILVFVEPPVEKPDPKEQERGQDMADRLKARREEAKQRLKERLPLFADLIDKEEA